MILPDVLRKQAAEHPDRVAVVVDGIGQMTYGEWDRRSNQLARALELEPGERIGLQFSNDRGLDYLIAYMAIHKAGLVAVPINTKLTGREIAGLIDHSGARLVLGVEAVEPHPDSSEYQVPREPTDLADLLYTSGTTGTPKGVACTHENILFRGSSTLTRMFAGVTFLHSVPLFTFAGTHAMTLICLRGGMTHVLQPRFDPGRFLEILAERKVALSYVVPAMALRLLDEPAAAAGTYGSLRLLMYGTAPMPPDGVRRLAEAFPSTFLLNLYGLTEGGAAVCSLSPMEAAKRPDSLGKPLPPTELKIVDDSGEIAAADEPGEIWMKTAVKPRWYFRDEEATATAWHDGWLKTGDIGYLDADGYLYLVDRKKDLIIAGGHNISAPEVEGVLLEHPAVREAAIVGHPHKTMGEVPRACVVLRQEASPESLEAFLRERLADYKVPRNWTFLDELPRNALGKVLKRELR